MKTASLQLNLVIAWLWLLLGFVAGMVLGWFFHRDDWLGGYASFRRRMYRLAHVSFFGLGAVNLLFWLTVKNLSTPGATLGLASGAFALGAVTMPLCCVLVAHFPRSRMCFAAPVLSLIVGGAFTLMAVAKL